MVELLKALVEMITAWINRKKPAPSEPEIKRQQRVETESEVPDDLIQLPKFRPTDPTAFIRKPKD